MEILRYVFLILSIFIFILILIFVFRKRLRVFIIKLLHGKFSYRYLSTLSKIYLDLNHPPALRYDPLYVVKNFTNNYDVSHFQTSGNINFQGYEIGKSYPHFFKEAGDPYYLTISENEKDLVKFVVVGYKQLIYNYEAVLLFFLWNNTLFAGQYQIRREKQKVNPLDLASKLMAKYFIKNEKLDENKFKIKGSDGNEVYFEDTGFAIEISIYNPKLIEQFKVPVSENLMQKKITEEKASATF